MVKKNKTVYSKYRMISFVIISLISLILLFTQSFYSLNQSLIYDNFQGTNDFVNNVVVVKIDDASINSIGRWPWNRSIYSNAIEKLSNASLIGFDVSFFEKSNDDLILNNTINKYSSKIVMVNEVSNEKKYNPIFDVKTGYANLINDNDGVIRKTFFNLNNQNSLAQTLYANYFNENFNSTNYGLNAQQKTNDALIFFSNDNIPSLSFKDLFNNSVNVNALTKNKIVLIGATAADLHDMFLTPIVKETLTPGVFIHANILNSMMLKSFIFRINDIYLILFILLMAFMFFRVKNTKSNTLYFILTLIIILGLTFVLFFFFNLYFNVFLLIFSLSLFFIVNVIVFNILMKQKKNYISNVFNKYISKDLLDQILENNQELELGGKDKRIGILFSDIRNFTTISEKLNAKQTLNMLNEFFNEATFKLMNKKGFIDKFIGDAIMALWNVPISDSNYVNNLVESSIELKELVLSKQNHMKKKYDIPFDIGIGINVDNVIVGNLGGDGKLNYTAIGDGVNLASRLEGLTKNYGVKIISSENVIADSDFDKSKFLFRKLDIVKVKGKDIAITIYEIIGNKFKNEKDNLKIIEFINLYEKAFDLMLSKDFDSAFVKFDELYDKYNDKASLVMRERIVILKSKTLDELKEWDGSFKFTSK